MEYSDKNTGKTEGSQPGQVVRNEANDSVGKKEAKWTSKNGACGGVKGDTLSGGKMGYEVTMLTCDSWVSIVAKKPVYDVRQIGDEVEETDTVIDWVKEQITVGHGVMHKIMDRYAERFNEMVCSEVENAMQKMWNTDVESRCKIVYLLGGKKAVMSIFGLSLHDDRAGSASGLDGIMLGPAQARLLYEKMKESAKDLGWE